jgi:hypothetical protein
MTDGLGLEAGVKGLMFCLSRHNGERDESVILDHRSYYRQMRHIYLMNLFLLLFTLQMVVILGGMAPNKAPKLPEGVSRPRR